MHKPCSIRLPWDDKLLDIGCFMHEIIYGFLPVTDQAGQWKRAIEEDFTCRYLVQHYKCRRTNENLCAL